MNFPKLPVAIPKRAYVALFGLLFALYFVVQNAKVTPPPKPLREPITNPYTTGLAGTGIIEAADNNIIVSPYFGGKVAKLFVQEGDTVYLGQPLYALDTTELNAQVAQLGAQVASAQANVARLQHLPRPEALPALQATVAEAQAAYNSAQNRANPVTKSGSHNGH